MGRKIKFPENKAVIGTYFKSRQSANNFIAERKRKWHLGNSVKWIVLDSDKGFIVVDEKFL